MAVAAMGADRGGGFYPWCGESLVPEIPSGA